MLLPQESWGSKFHGSQKQHSSLGMGQLSMSRRSPKQGPENAPQTSNENTQTFNENATPTPNRERIENKKVMAWMRTIYGGRFRGKFTNIGAILLDATFELDKSAVFVTDIPSLKCVVFDEGLMDDLAILKNAKCRVTIQSTSEHRSQLAVPGVAIHSEPWVITANLNGRWVKVVLIKGGPFRNKAVEVTLR
eukprot:Lankesteria_metandrocarpae@DN4791_c0_g1_i2.p1